jgi:hypothetical protein
MANFILCLNLISTWYMVGLIWVVQVVHYPLFANVSAENYIEYQQLHERYITPVVGVPMIIEIVTAILLLSYLPKGVSATWVWVALILLFVVWLSTAFLQVPCHAKLNIAFDADAHRRLVDTNWIRTVCWTLRGVLVAWFVFGQSITTLRVVPVE